MSFILNPDKVDEILLFGDWHFVQDFRIGEPIIVGGGDVSISEPWFAAKISGTWIDGPLSSVSLVREGRD